nr:fused MFS/spermidine synthase [Lewinella sp. W8]
MVVELSGAKIIAPYYGSSLFVWAAVLCISVGALAAGYFLGGHLSKRADIPRSLLRLFLLGSGLTLLLPFLADLVLRLVSSLPLTLAVIVGPLLFLLPPIVCMGAISPLLIQLVKQAGFPSGRATGNIFAISTVGGILATLAVSFYLIPFVGIRLTLGAAALLMALAGALVYFFLRQRIEGTAAEKEELSAGGPAVRSLSTNVLLGISFLEGGALMITELLGAKITGPFYGTSIYVWGAVLAVTLLALSLGYYLGGRLTGKKQLERSLFLVLLGAGFLIAMSPVLGTLVLPATDVGNVQLGALLAVMVYLLPPVILLAMVSPMITHLISADYRSGKAAGTVYSISTVGGILGTLLGGFLLIPSLGIRVLALALGGGLVLLAGVYFLRRRQYQLLQLAGFLVILGVLLQPGDKSSSNTKIVYHSTGILGEWTVVDYFNIPGQAADQVERRLLLNGIDQTYTQIGFEPLSLWTYPHKLAAYASMKPAGSKALLLGMGGGSIAFELVAMGLEVDIVELDPRVKEIATDYFNYDPSTSSLIFDDARHYIRTVDRQYDVVIVDLVSGEVQPSHVFSLEGFEELKKIIAEDALVIVNFQGNLYSPRYNQGPKSVYKTMEAAGFNVSYYSPKSKEQGKEDLSLTKDIFFVASQVPQNYREKMANLRYNEWFPYDDFGYDRLIKDDPIDLSGAEVLVDDRPKLELLNAPSILKWRQNKLEQNANRLLDEVGAIY